MASSKIKFAKQPRLAAQPRRPARIDFGKALGQRQTEADRQIAALVKNYTAQAKASAEIHKALGLHSVADTANPTTHAFHAQGPTYHRYP